jgi:hypothetical protein
MIRGLIGLRDPGDIGWLQAGQRRRHGSAGRGLFVPGTAHDLRSWNPAPGNYDLVMTAPVAGPVGVQLEGGGVLRCLHCGRSECNYGGIRSLLRFPIHRASRE